MEKKTIFRDRQELQASDFNNIEEFAADALQHFAQDAVSNSLHYTGLTVAKTSSTEVSVGAGRFWNDGKVYAYAQAQTLNLFQYLPFVAKKIVAVVVWGQESDTQTEPRDFLIDLTNGTTEPQAVPMERARIANVNLLPGAESADPQPPVIQTGMLAVAYVVMTPLGIERIEMQTGNRLPNLRDHEQRLGGVEVWKAATDPAISSVRSDLAALAQKTASFVTLDMLLDLQRELGALKTAMSAPANTTIIVRDPVVDDSKADTAHSGYAARINGGILFPAAAEAKQALSLFNPLDPLVVKIDGAVFPAYAEVPKLATSGYAGDLQINTFQSQSHSYQPQAPQETAIKAGYAQNRNPGWFRDCFPESSANQIEFEGLTARARAANKKPVLLRTPLNYSVIQPPAPYQPSGAPQSVQGALLAQTFLVSNAMWLTKVGLSFTRLATGNITLQICETEAGKPRLGAALATVTLDPTAPLAGQIFSTYPNESQIPIPRTFLEPGKQYALVVITEGSHRIAMVVGDTFAQGTCYYGVDGNYQSVNTGQDLMFTLYGAEFPAKRLEVQLQPLSLAGGIRDIWLNAQQIVPEGCSLDYEIQVNGTWHPLSNAHLALVGTPALVGLRAVMVSTRDVAPCLVEKAEAFTVSRPATDLVHYGLTITPPSAATQVKVVAIIHGFNGNDHTIALNLIRGASSYNPSVTSTEATPDGRALKVESLFTGISLADFQVKVTGTCTSGAAPFSVSELTAYCV